VPDLVLHLKREPESCSVPERLTQALSHFHRYRTTPVDEGQFCSCHRSSPKRLSLAFLIRFTSSLPDVKRHVTRYTYALVAGYGAMGLVTDLISHCGD
jgi:hypothetical protein